MSHTTTAMLRAYLYLRRGNGSIITAYCTDLESLVRAWTDRGGCAALLHVGFGSLSVDEVDVLLEGRDGQTLYTAAAKHVLPSPFCAPDSEVGLVGGGVLYGTSSPESTEAGAAAPDAGSPSGAPSPSPGLPDWDALPEWMLTVPLRALQLPTRLHHALERSNIVDVRGIVALGPLGLMAVRGFGETSLQQIITRLTCILKEGPLLIAPCDDPPDLATRSTTPSSASSPIGTLPAAGSEPDLPLLDRLNVLLNSLEERKRLIISSRMGLIGKSATLEEIGQLLSVSRERVRQLESKALHSVRLKLGADLERRVASFGDPTREVRTVEELEADDSWFRGVSQQKSAFAYLLEVVCEPPWHVLAVGGSDYVTRCSQSRWNELLRQARHIVDAAAEDRARLTRQQLGSRLETLVASENVNLSTLLWRELMPDMRFAWVGGQELLCGFGRSAEQYVAEILEEADRPLHYSEIHETLAARAVEFNVNHVHNALQSAGLRFGPGTYGLRRHLPLTDDEADALVRTAEDVVFEEDPLQQWHADELLQEIEERGFVGSVALNPYILGIALAQSTRLRSLGRMVWAADSTTYQERREILDAVRDVLEEAGRPLATREVRELIGRTRKVASAFQIHPQGDVIRVGPGLWGLRHRDVPFTDAEIEQLMDMLVACLAEQGKGIDVSEIESVLRERAPWAVKDVFPHLFLGLAKRDARLAITRRGVIYLAAWQNSRRQTAAGVIRTVLGDAGSDGLRLDEVHRMLEEKIGRSVARAACTSMLIAVGARYDPVNKRWVLASTD